jgi:hypothetical protein
VDKTSWLDNVTTVCNLAALSRLPNSLEGWFAYNSVVIVDQATRWEKGRGENMGIGVAEHIAGADSASAFASSVLLGGEYCKWINIRSSPQRICCSWSARTSQDTICYQQ